MEAQVERHKPATASVRFRALQQFFKFLAAEGDIKSSPMAGMSPPIIPEEPVPVIPDDDLDKLVRITVGTGFFDRRDHACIRFFLDTGVRVAEAAGMDVDDVDLDHCVARVLGKGRKPARNSVPVAARTITRDLSPRVDRRSPGRVTVAATSAASGAGGRLGAPFGPGLEALRPRRRCGAAGGIGRQRTRRATEGLSGPI
jgi:site-specific recombinase XerC